MLCHCSQCYKECTSDWQFAMTWHNISTGSFTNQDMQLMLLILQLGAINPFAE